MGLFDSIGKSPLDREISRYEKLASEKPENPSLRNILGDLYLKKGLSARAAQYYRETVELFLRARQEEKAVALMRKLIGHDLYELKEIETIFDGFLAWGRKTEIISLYTQLAKKKLTTSRPLANDVFRKILELDPDNAEALLFFGQGKQDIEEASGLIKGEALTEESAFSSAEVSAEERSEVSLVPETVLEEPAALPMKTTESRESAQHQQIRIRVPEKPSDEKQSDESAAAALKDKFIDIAKEKRQLETTILEQIDTIRRLERDSAALRQKFNNLSDANKKLKDKLVDYDILRNMEISELKKKIDELITENKRLSYEREQLLQTGDDQQRASMEAGLDRGALERQMEEAQRHVLQTEEKLRRKDSALVMTQDSNRKLSEENMQILGEKEKLQRQLIAVREEDEKVQALRRDGEKELADAKVRLAEMNARTNELEHELAELRRRTQAAPAADAELRQQAISQEQEINSLKVDIDELTHSMEAKIHEGDQLKTMLSHSESQLKQKEQELGEKVPFLRSKINRLSEIIDYKLEEHSLFAKELADVNQKIVALHEEIIKKDELLMEISQGYREEQEQLQEINRQHETEKGRFLKEYEELRRNFEALKEAEDSAARATADLEKEKSILEDQLSEAAKKILELEQASVPAADTGSIDQVVADLNDQHETEVLRLRQEIETLRTELQDGGEERESKDLLISEIKQDLHREVAGLVMEIEGLKEEKSNLQGLVMEQRTQIGRLADENTRLAGMLSDAGAETERLGREKEDALDRAQQEITSCNLTISQLQANLESALQENILLRESPEDKPGQDVEKGKEHAEVESPPEEVAVPAEGELVFVRKEDVLPERKRIRWSHVFTPVLLAAVIFGGMLVYQTRILHEATSPVAVQKTSDVPLPPALTYNEIFDRLTREQKTELTRSQATMVTDSLVKAGTTKKDDSTLRFDSYHYFRITLNALKGHLDKEIIENPASSVRLLHKGGSLSADSDIALKEMKVFSRREQPVSVSFLAAFSRADFQEDLKELSLAVIRNDEEMVLGWNLQELQAQQIIP